MDASPIVVNLLAIFVALFYLVALCALIYILISMIRDDRAQRRWRR